MTRLQTIVKKNKEFKKVPQKLLGVRLDQHKVNDLMRLACRYNISLKQLVSAMVDDFLTKELKGWKR